MSAGPAAREHKRFPLCGQDLPAAAFGRNGAYLSSYCRSCASRREQERQRRKREGASPLPAPRDERAAAQPLEWPAHLHPQALAGPS